MEFSKRKLSTEAVPSLLRLKIERVKPYSLMLAPTYVFLQANGKLLPIKAPLDFFTPEELNRFQSYEYFYFSNFIESVLPYQEAGVTVRQALSWKNSSRATPPIPYAVSNKILQVLGPLWGDQGDGEPGIEPFLAAVCANEVCGLLPPDKLLKAREENVLNLDQALLTSSWSVFRASPGYYDSEFLRGLRLRVFDEIMSGQTQFQGRDEVEDLIAFAHSSLELSHLHAINPTFLRDMKERIAHKLLGRLERISREFLRLGQFHPLFLEKGGLSMSEEDRYTLPLQLNSEAADLRSPGKGRGGLLQHSLQYTTFR